MCSTGLVALVDFAGHDATEPCHSNSTTTPASPLATTHAHTYLLVLLVGHIGLSIALEPGVVLLVVPPALPLELLCRGEEAGVRV